MWSPVEGVEVVDYVEHAVGSGRFHNLQLFESIDSPWVVLEELEIVKRPLPTACST